jgi:pentatricopeptide repeat protein
MPRHRSSPPIDDCTTGAAPSSFEDPGGLRWNDGDRHHLPNHVRITGVMRGYARHSRPRDAERLLDLMMSLSSCSSSSGVVGDPRDRDRRDRATMFRPNDVGYATVIDAYSRAQDGPNAERILGMMKRRGGGRDDDDDERGNGNRANVVAYNAAISAWARSARERRAPPPPAGGRGDDRRATPSSRSFAAAAPTPADIASSRRAAEGAERLLREMWSEHDISRGAKVRRGSAILLPDVVSYSAVISAYAACMDQPYGIGRARELLAELEGLAARQEVDESTTGGGGGRSNPSRRFEGSDDGCVGGGGGRHPHGFRPNALTYNALLQAYANAGDASSAEGVLLSMISWHASSLREEGGGGRFMHVRPNTRTFNVVLNALARVEGGDGGVRASELLGRLVELGSSDDDGPRPDVISYNTVLAAWSKSAGVRPGESPSAGEGGAQKRKGVVGEFAAHEALRLLDEIEGRYLQSVESKTHGRSFAVKPDVISYNTTIAAFANAAQHCEDGTPTARKAEEILSRMIESGIEPDAYSYNGVLLAWARSSGGLPAARHAETILRSMKEPTIVSWSTVVTAYAHADGAPRAEALLREMEENAAGSSWRSKGHRTPITPSVVLYNNVLHSWGVSSHGDASRNAELLLNRMEAASSSPAPDAISYRLVLNALEHSKDHDKAERAKSVLDRFLAFEIRNSRFKPHEIQNAYNSVLAACTYTPAEAGEHHRNNAARILLETLRDMNMFPWPADDGGSVSGPNQETYANFVQGCVHLYGPVSEERNELLKSAFSECCQKGFLNRVICDKFCVAMGPEAVREFAGELLSSRGQTWPRYEELPKEWSRNCPRC